MTLHRAIVSPTALLAGAGGEVVIRGAEHNHMNRVLRLRAGDRVGLFDGCGVGWIGTILRTDGETTRVILDREDSRRVEPSTSVTLVQSLPQHADRMDFLVQKSTECGVFRIVPAISARTAPRAQGGGAARLHRWRRIAIEAAKQSGRLRVPQVEEPSPMSEAISESALPQKRLILTTEEDDAVPLAAAGVSPAEGVVVAVGPEGGWTDGELRSAREAGFRPVGLGPRILRSETAGIVAVALVLCLSGQMDAGAASDRHG